MREISKPFIAPKAPVAAAPVQTKQPVATPANPELSKPSQSMIQRLKEKGVTIPEKDSPRVSVPPQATLQKSQPKIETSMSVSEAGEAPSGDSQPPAPAWPEENQQ
jgi:hypothetical protein